MKNIYFLAMKKQNFYNTFEETIEHRKYEGVKNPRYPKLRSWKLSHFKEFVRNMVGFHFERGSRRCIKPILEKYQSVKDQTLFQ